MLYVPAVPAPPALALSPAGILSPARAILAAPVRTSLRVRSSQLDVLATHRASVTGVLQEGHLTARAGRVVTLEALGRRGWRTLAETHTGARGGFRLRYIARRPTSERVRLHFAGDGDARPAHRPLGRLNVYRLAGASWYAGGGHLACGGSLTSSTLGVANKSLPCGTLVTLHYNGRSVRVPVVDRGPYVAGREFDLTEATKRVLGFGDTGQVWSTC